MSYTQATRLLIPHAIKVLSAFKDLLFVGLDGAQGED